MSAKTREYSTPPTWSKPITHSSAPLMSHSTGILLTVFSLTGLIPRR
nr:MAG TPA: hypothetical protein [Caudoviricetes sp.]